MNSLLGKLVEKAKDTTDLAVDLAESQIQSVSNTVKGMRLFGALSAQVSEEVEYDETHYVLVPVSKKHVVYTKRVLPPGIGATNDLPKKRVFHVPEKSGQSILEDELISQIVKESRCDQTSNFADKLDALADSIDQEVGKVSGGLLLIGGAVALVNPAIGVGIAVKGLLPSIGAKASKFGANYVGDKMRSWQESAQEVKLNKAASKQVKGLKPEVFSNPLVQSLEALCCHADYDPFLDSKNWVGEFAHYHYFSVTLEAIAEVYANQQSEGIDESPLLRSWLQHLSEMR